MAWPTVCLGPAWSKSPITQPSGLKFTFAHGKQKQAHQVKLQGKTARVVYQSSASSSQRRRGYGTRKHLHIHVQQCSRLSGFSRALEDHEEKPQFLQTRSHDPFITTSSSDCTSAVQSLYLFHSCPYISHCASFCFCLPLNSFWTPCVIGSVLLLPFAIRVERAQQENTHL